VTGHDNGMSSQPPLRLVVRLTPRGGRDAVDGWARDEDGRPYLKARVAAPPLEGAANSALENLIAKALKRPRGAVRIVGGDHARLKQLEIAGVSPADLTEAFGTPD
jgi:uncharacterized protein YggU (UPF0235/DUF167 family)